MLRSLRLRLLAMILVVMAPLAVFIAIEARTTYDTAIQALHASQQAVAVNVGIQMRIGLATGRRVLTTLMSATENISDPLVCDRTLARALFFAPGTVAVEVRRKDGLKCSALAPDQTAKGPALQEMLLRPLPAKPSEVLPGYHGQAFFGSGRIGSEGYLIVGVASPAEGGADITGALAIDVRRFTVAMDALGTVQSGTVALFGDGPEALLVKGAEQAKGQNWLPVADLASLPDEKPVTLSSRDGMKRSYVLNRIKDSNLFFIAGFRTEAEQSIFHQFLALLLAPFATLLIIGLAYTRMIRIHVLRWTTGLADAARSIAGNREARAPDDEAMPDELRQVGQSFNMMVERQAVRERRLKEALAHNQHLSRELHHRIKNSLQIVQSYIGLSKRSKSGEVRRALLVTECRVNALSTAYRLALAHGELRDADIDEYLEAVASSAGSLLAPAGATVKARFKLNARTEIDLLTPLGLILIEALVEVFEEGRSASVQLSGSIEDGDRRILRIRVEGEAVVPRNDKLLRGLILQAQARDLTAAEPGLFLALELSQKA